MPRGSNKGRHFPATPLSVAEARAVIDAANPRYASGARNRALLAVLWRGGLRVAEACSLRPSDVDVERFTVFVRSGKGAKPRIAVVDARTVRFVQDWLERRPTDSEWLFCSRTGRRLLTSYVRATVKRLAARAGVEKRVHPHVFRHTHARELVEAGVPLSLIRDQLGHSNIATTDAYLRTVAPSQRIEALAGRDW